MTINDIHSHTPRQNSIANIEPGETMQPGMLYSVGIHPWHIDENSDFSAVENMAQNPQVVAIGETGLDTLCSAVPIELQNDYFIKHIELSEQLGKPLIIHCVRAHEQIIQLHRQLHPRQPWIFHGFRLRPSIAEKLIKEGIYLSLGYKFNQESAKIIPNNLLLIETDDSPDVSIEEVASRVAQARNTSMENILKLTESNISELFQAISC